MDAETMGTTVCSECLHDFARSDHLHRHRQRGCRGIPGEPSQLCETCWQWIRGSRHHLERHQRSSRCRSLEDREARRHQLAQSRRDRDAAWHRRARATTSLQADSQNVPDMDRLFEDIDTDFDALFTPTLQGEDNHLIQMIVPIDGGAVTSVGGVEDVLVPDTEIGDLLATADFDFNDVGLQEETQDLHHTPPPASVDVDQPAVFQPRDGVTDCPICMCELAEPVWVCTDGTCRQPYHRECAKNAIEHDPRCANCRTTMEIQLEDDEVMVVQHVAAPRKCIICNQVITGIVLEGMQCSHTVDFECLADYNYQFLRITRMQDFQCPQCRHPFPPPPYFQQDDGAVGQGHMSPEEAGSDEDSKDNNSGDDYHASDFASSSESDEDYDPNEAQE